MAKTNLERELERLENLRKRGVVSEEEYSERRRALLASTAAEPERRSGIGRILKWGFFGCLGATVGVFIVVIGLIVIIAAAVGGSSEEGGDVRVALEAGASGDIFPEFNDDKVSRVTILQVVDGVESGILAPPAGKKIWGVEVVVENAGTSEVTSLDWKLRDSEDFEHEREFFVDAGEQLEVIYADLTPGAKVQGWVYFEINEGATAKWLRADPNPFVSNDLYFDAE